MKWLVGTAGGKLYPTLKKRAEASSLKPEVKAERKENAAFFHSPEVTLLGRRGKKGNLKLQPKARSMK